MASNVENIFYISEKPWHSLGVNFALSTAKRYREINHIGLNTVSYTHLVQRLQQDYLVRF